MSPETLRLQAVRAAEPLFCARGIGAVRMEDVRDASGVSLRRLYQLFSSKESLAIECLRARDAALYARLQQSLVGVPDPIDRLLGVFDCFGAWFEDPGFNGCSWINSYGEMAGTSSRVVEKVREAKAAFRTMLGTMCEDADLGDDIADTLMVLAQGAIVCAAIQDRSEPAWHARRAAEIVIRARPNQGTSHAALT